jgi:hypothetical protein
VKELGILPDGQIIFESAVPLMELMAVAAPFPAENAGMREPDVVAALPAMPRSSGIELVTLLHESAL